MNALLEQLGPEMSPAWHHAVNKWLVSRPDFICQADTRELTLRWLEGNRLATVAVYILFECNGHRWAVGLDSLRVFDARLAGEPFVSLPATLRTLTLQKLLSEIIVLLPEELSKNIDTPTIEWGRVTWLQNWQKLPFTLENALQRTQSNGVLLVERPETLLWLHEHLPQGRSLRTSNLSKVLNYLTQLHIGQTELSLDQLKQLEVGDLLWIETARIAGSGLQAWFELHANGNAVAYQGSLRQQYLTIRKEKPCPYKPPVKGGVLPSDFTENNQMQIETGQLELPVTFDLGEIVLPMADLERIGPNYVFELPCEATDAVVNVRVNGMLVAQGQLTIVGRKLGVRLTKVRMGDTMDSAA